ncbi:MAG TPA: hypothetical protein DIV86_04535 [Alphaproteobacteria bacterium]|nr:hypothetical protein [Alphaproteobacteria bacterium]
MNKLLTTAALAGIVAIASTGAMAEEAASKKVQCAGIAKAGQNSCKSLDGSHSCAGAAKKDNDPNEWTYAASKEECEKAGGKIVEVTM